jgi:tetratricopeptide (TPR) repeat protein
MKKIISLLLILLCTLNVFCNEYTLQKLQTIQKLDTITIKEYLEKGKEYQNSKPDSALYFHQFLYDKLEQNKLPNASLNSLYFVKILREIGWDFYLLGNFEKSIETYKEAIKELNKNKIKDNHKKDLFTAHLNGDIGVVYMQQGEYSIALEFLFLGLKSYDKIKNKSGQSTSNLNIGIIYYYLKNFEKALEYLERAKIIIDEMDDKSGVGNILIMMGAIHIEKKSYDNAILSFSEALTIQQEIGDNTQINACLANLGMAYRKKGELKIAITYYEEALVLARKTKNLQVETIQLINLGTIYSEMKNCKRSVSYFSEAIPLAKVMNSKKELEALYMNISDAYYLCGDYKNSLDSYHQYIKYRDSLNSEEINKELFEKDLKYSFEKKATADSVANAKSQEIKDIEIAKEKAEKTALRNQQYLLYGGLGLLLIFGIFMFNRFKVTQKQRDVINSQKNEVEKQKMLVEEQKQLIEEKHHEITDSINYAKRIQEAILPSRHSLVENLKNGFIFFKPKDVVSGDFYWLEKTTPLAPSIGGGTGVVYFAAADCTGHGVPGALVSVICSNALSKALLEEGITETGKLLDRTRELVIERFAKSGEQVKDGMDISLCKLTGNTLEWSGANNPLWVIRKNTEGEYELQEFKPDKQPIGNYSEPKPFTTQAIQLAQGDSIYIFTDGYADQFGGPKGKKFMYKPFKELLLSFQNKSMDEQKNILEKQFEDWRGTNEQIDDVCIIGVRL